MSNLCKSVGLEQFIANQWASNAQSRLVELSNGTDFTYTKVICPILLSLLSKLSLGKAVVDVGCGLGFFANFIKLHGYEVTGIDISESVISLAQKAFPDIEFHTSNICSWNPSKCFDACVVNMVFHNVPDVFTVAKAIAGKLEQGGVLIGCIPNPKIWFPRRISNAKSIFLEGQRAFLMPFRIRGSLVHPSEFTYFQRDPSEYWQALKRAGFTIIEAINADKVKNIPDDLIFFYAKR